MDYLRTIVSGKKKRFTEEGFNLDLTYITNRIVAMAFPAQGFESLYRNPIDKVAQLLELRHKNSYKVFNLSGRDYNYSKFNSQVESFRWANHHAPQLHILFEICQKIHIFLNQKKENIVIVHCLAGKGRTGTLICCYLLYCRMCTSVEQVLEFYEKQRFNTTGLGVNQPCQIRYIEYFNRLMTEGNLNFPTQKYLSQIIIEDIPNFNHEKGCKIYAKIYQNQVLVKQTQIVRMTNQKQTDAILILPGPLLLQGDILLEFFDSGMVKNRKMMRVSFNTMFDDKCFTKQDLDPYKIMDDNRIRLTFKLHLTLAEFCNFCNNKTEFDQKCIECRNLLKQQEIYWQQIQEAIKYDRTPQF